MFVSFAKKASNKLHQLARTSKDMTKDKLKTMFFFLLSLYIAPQLGCSIIEH